MNYKITVVIPVSLNHEQYITRAVDSIQYQTYKYCSWKIVRDYNSIGKGLILNTVINEIDTDFVTFHDADDQSHLLRFDECSDYFDNYDVIYHDYYLINGFNKEEINVPNWDRERYKRESFICASSVIVRTEIAKKVKWQTGTYGQDWIWLNLIAQHTDRFIRVSKPLLYYYANTGFTSRMGKYEKKIKRYFLRRKIAKLTNE